MVFITKLQYSQHLCLKNRKKKNKFFPTSITVSSFYCTLSMRLVFLFYAQDIYSTDNVRCIHTHIVCYSAELRMDASIWKSSLSIPRWVGTKKATTDQMRGTNSRIMDRNVLCAFSCLRCSFFCFLFPTSKWVIDPLSAWALILLFYDFLFFYRLPRGFIFN